MSMNKVFPFVDSFRDYHEIDIQGGFLRKHFGRIHSKEICFDRDYWGVFWVHSERPSREDVLEMLKKAKCNLEYAHEEFGGVCFR